MAACGFSSIVVRRARLSDLESIYRIEVECFGEDAFPKSYIRWFIEENSFITLVALLDDKIIGFIAGLLEVFMGRRAGHVYSIDVKPEYRGRGVGSRLLEAIEDELRRCGAEICYLEARVDNVVALNLYFKHDYRIIERLKNYYGFGRDGVRLIKNLVIE
ncbi:GNAT family N-acetyltransferase [Candidatus Bathyarchaeota archaeon]|nr:GNAT family N-acetyltransferase [Candidatus Bathyarchaeota archaeon]